MQTIIWAIGSMILLMLIISLLPLGYTFKGKFFVVLASFILALGGLAAASTFPLWQTALMLLGLIFFASYFMNNRLSTLINKENPMYEEIFDEEFDHHNTKDLIQSNLFEIDEELSLPDSSTINFEKEIGSELSPSTPISDIENFVDDKADVIDEDILFLLDRNNEVVVNEEIEETNLENGYLSEIESLLEMDSENEVVEEDVLDELPDPSIISFEEKAPDQIVGHEDETLDDSLFEFLLAKKEVAVDCDDTIEEIETKKPISLQK